MIHQGKVDDQGNYRDIGRKKEGYFDMLGDRPFEALVTAWHPKSQTIDIIVPIQFGNIELDEVAVYGNFFESTGTIYTPKIATTLDSDGYSTVQKPEQIDPNSEEYVLNNHIQALVFKTNSGEFVANSFRFLSADSQMLNNVKEGRKITRHDDGSYSIHDEDGNMQFKHPSGLNVRIGTSSSDIELDEDFDEHEKNVQDYNGEVIFKFEHPAGFIFEVTADGIGNITAPDTLNFTAPNVNINASTKFKVTSPETEITGNLTVGAVIKAIGDIIAASAGAAIKLLSHLHIGNLGGTVSVPQQSSASIPNPAVISGDVNINGILWSTHGHPYTWTDGPGSGTTGDPQ